MPIQVTCPGCLSRFSVSDKFAGKKGPCPKCKKEISIPTKAEEVVIHAPEPTGPKDSQGKVILKPIRRTDTLLTRRLLVFIAGAVLFFLGGALFVRFSMPGNGGWLLGLGAILMAPLLVRSGYEFLRDAELEGYRGKELLARTAICSAIFAGTWGLYVFLSWYFEFKSLAETSGLLMAFFLVAMIAVGSVASLASFELEFGQAFLHYSLYLLVTLLLCSIAGVAIGEPLAVIGVQTPASTATPKPTSSTNSPASGSPTK